MLIPRRMLPGRCDAQGCGESLRGPGFGSFSSGTGTTWDQSALPQGGSAHLPEAIGPVSLSDSGSQPGHFVTRGHLAVSAGIFSHRNCRGYYRYLVGRGQGRCQASLKAQDITDSKVSNARHGSPGLTLPNITVLRKEDTALGRQSRDSAGPVPRFLVPPCTPEVSPVVPWPSQCSVSVNPSSDLSGNKPMSPLSSHNPFSAQTFAPFSLLAPVEGLGFLCHPGTDAPEPAAAPSLLS